MTVTLLRVQWRACALFQNRRECLRSFDKRAEAAPLLLEGMQSGEGPESLCERDAARKQPGLPGCPASSDTLDIERAQESQALSESGSTDGPGLNRPLRIIGHAGLGPRLPAGGSSIGRDTFSPEPP